MNDNSVNKTKKFKFFMNNLKNEMMWKTIVDLHTRLPQQAREGRGIYVILVILLISTPMRFSVLFEIRKYIEE